MYVRNINKDVTCMLEGVRVASSDFTKPEPSGVSSN
jgi:hypothetical protein